MKASISRRVFAASAFTIVPRHVLGGTGYVAPSDKVTLAAIGMGRQGMAITMDLLREPEIQVVAVCDPNQGSKDYAEYGRNAMLQQARRTLGPGYENWGEDLASPGEVMLTNVFRTSLGFGGREPAKRVVEAYYAGHKPSGVWNGCNAYRDFRELLEKEKGLDAVYVATPDHWHAPIAIAAMKRGKHVLGQKPMTHNIGEARRMAQTAREMRVSTSVTVANASSESTRLIASWIAAGAIGPVREVHNWSSRPYWPQGVARPKDEQAVPPGLDWNLWLGPAPARPYNKAYLPFVWRGWYDFGCGSFGDMGCYSFAGIFKILDLAPPVAVESTTSEPFEETYPKASLVHLSFAARGGMPPVRLSWYDGGLKPPRPEGLSDEQARRYFARNAEGIMYVGEKGIILGGFNGDNPRVLPDNPNYRSRETPRGRGPERRDPVVEQFIAGCKGGPLPAANFGTQAPVTEAFLLGCIAQRMPGEKLRWDTAAMKFDNTAANQYVDPPYRTGW
ncbi:MAG: Gfo/Idh/MocA family protein [Bryobacteraceae bacterium]